MTAVRRPKWKKAAFAAVLGGLAGYAAMYAFFERGGGEQAEALGGGRVAVGAVGLIYLLTGALVGLGLLAPGAGAKVLNVEDGDELREMRGPLSRSSVSFLLTGTLLFLLSGSGPGGHVNDNVVLGLTGLVVLVVAVLTWLTHRAYDELWRQLSNESSTTSLGLLLPALLVWGVLDHLGRAEFTPVGVIALTAAIVLLGTFITLGRRGMLTLK